MNLRDYQSEATQKVHNSWVSGHKRPLLVLPCG